MIIDRRAAYFAESSTDRARDGLEFQRRYLAGLRFLAILRERNRAAPASGNVTIMRRRRKT